MRIKFKFKCKFNSYKKNKTTQLFNWNPQARIIAARAHWLPGNAPTQIQSKSSFVKQFKIVGKERMRSTMTVMIYSDTFDPMDPSQPIWILRKRQKKKERIKGTKLGKTLTKGSIYKEPMKNKKTYLVRVIDFWILFLFFLNINVDFYNIKFELCY